MYFSGSLYLYKRKSEKSVHKCELSGFCFVK